MKDVKIALQREILTIKINGRITNEAYIPDGRYNPAHRLRIGRDAIKGEGIVGIDISFFDMEVSVFFADGTGLIFPLVWDKSDFEPRKFVEPTAEFSHFLATIGIVIP